jgi:GTP-binding protein SAR1
MGWFDWFWSILAAFSWENKTGRILFLGLDNAGKTTLLGKMASGQVHVHRPTQHPNQEDLELDGIKIKTIDMGGHEDARRLWRDYFIGVSGVVFLVDAAAPHRFPEAKIELDKLLQADELQGVPFCLLYNKIDMPTAQGPPVVSNALGVSNILTGKGKPAAGVRPLEAFPTSVVNNQGYGDGMRWMSQFLK